MGIVRSSATVSLTPNTQKQYIKQLKLPFKNQLANPTADIIEKVIKIRCIRNYILVIRSQ